jgi:hypothetical protein
MFFTFKVKRLAKVGFIWVENKLKSKRDSLAGVTQR